MFRLETLAMHGFQTWLNIRITRETWSNLPEICFNSFTVGPWNLLFFSIKSPLGDSNDGLHLEATVLENRKKLSKWLVLFLKALFKSKPIVQDSILGDKRSISV